MRATGVFQAASVADLGGKGSQAAAAGATTARNNNVDTDSDITLSSDEDD